MENNEYLHVYVCVDRSWLYFSCM